MSGAPGDATDQPPEDRARATAVDQPPEDGSERRGDGSERRDDGAEHRDTVVDQLESQLRRALADLENLRKRTQREVAQARAAERARVAAAFIPVVDNLERALAHAADDPDAVMAGVQAVHAQALAVLADLGFPRFEDVGEHFDPHRHEALGTVEADAAPGTIVTAVQPGYGTEDAILRPAGVVIARRTA